MTSQLSSTIVINPQQQQQQQMLSVPLPKDQKGTAPSQQPVDVHPLQGEVQADGEQEGQVDTPQRDTADEPQAHDQSLGATAQWEEGGELSGGAAFGSWASAAQHGDWAVMEWLACQALPALVAAVRMVSPHPETEALRYPRPCKHAVCVSLFADLPAWLFARLYTFPAGTFLCIFMCLVN